MGQIDRCLRKLVQFPIVFYKYCISPVLGPRCRFYPSCSEYALSALKVFGLRKGAKMACCRILRCHPWSDGGYDPVLPNREKP